MAPNDSEVVYALMTFNYNNFFLFICFFCRYTASSFADVEVRKSKLLTLYTLIGDA